MNYINFTREEIEYLINYFESECNGMIKNSMFFEAKLYKKLKRSLIPIKISSRKEKGKNLQKWICNKIANLLGIKYNQQDDQCEIHSREMGQSGVDIILRGKALKRFPFSIECKSSEQFNFKNTIEQIRNNSTDDTDWLIVYKKKVFRNPVVIMGWYAFERLFEKGVKNGKGNIVD